MSICEFQRMNAEQQKTAITALQSALTETRNVRILLVEDNAADEEIALRCLSAVSIPAICVRSAEEAIRQLSDRNCYWIVFLDLNLGHGIEGLAVLEWIKNSQMVCSVLVLTGFFAPSAQECVRAIELGAAAIILKPLTSELVQMIFKRVA